MKVVTFNVKYSPNLGDGVIAACLEAELARRLPDAIIVGLDLAGRTGRNHAVAAGRRVAALKVLETLPAFLRDALVEIIVRVRLQLRCRARWRNELSDADLVVVGGGQLIQDRDLNFPVKLAVVAAECRRRNVPIALYALGVSESHSPRGAALISSFLRAEQLVFAGARDADSLCRLRHRGVGTIVMTPDPGLLAARVWAAPNVAARSRAVVGLGITHPVVLRYHGERQADNATIVRLYRDMIQQLLASGYEVACFSNGAKEDESCLDEVIDLAGGPIERLSRAPACGTPRDLALLIADFDVVIAHRLHACILAYSYSVPHIGLCWDAKLQAFFASVGRSRYVVNFDDETVATIPGLVRAAQSEAICQNQHERVLKLTSSSIDHLARLLKENKGPQSIRHEDEALCWTNLDRVRT